MAGIETDVVRENEVHERREETLTTSGNRLTPGRTVLGGGYPPTNSPSATRSSSPGSSSFHTANPMDSRSEQSSLSGREEEEEEEEEEERLSVEIPSLEGMLTPLASHQTTRQPLSARPTLEEVDAATTRREKQRYEEDNEEDADVTVGAELTDRSSYGVGSEGSATLGRTFVVDQPKLSLAESDSVPPCPEKRPLGDQRPFYHDHHEEDDACETTPLLVPSSSSSHPTPSSHPHHRRSNPESETCCSPCSLL